MRYEREAKKIAKRFEKELRKSRRVSGAERRAAGGGGEGKREKGEHRGKGSRYYVIIKAITIG